MPWACWKSCVITSYSIHYTKLYELFNKYLARFGIETTFVSLNDYAGWELAIRPTTRMLFLETPSNPLTEVADIARLSDLAHSRGCKLVVDNCFCTPALQRPLALGADRNNFV